MAEVGRLTVTFEIGDQTFSYWSSNVEPTAADLEKKGSRILDLIRAKVDPVSLRVRYIDKGESPEIKMENAEAIASYYELPLETVRRLIAGG